MGFNSACKGLIYALVTLVEERVEPIKTDTL